MTKVLKAGGFPVTRAYGLARTCLCAGFLVWSLCYGYGQTSAVEIQVERNRLEVANLQQRMGGIEALALERRLTRLETITETNHHLLIGIALSVVLLLIETGLRIIRPKPG